MHNAADERKVKRQENRIKQIRNQELEDIKEILSRKSGVRFFRRMIEDAYIFKTTYTGNSKGVFLEGHKNFFLKYFDDVCASCPEKVQELLMRKKSKEEGEDDDQD